MKTTRYHGPQIRVIAIGGGTGLSTLLRGLKEYVYAAGSTRAGYPSRREADASRFPISDLAAVVTVTDDGGSSGRLRREYGMLPPGDIRNCMVALSQDEALMGPLFQYRFPAGGDLKGHSFGNLFLTALSHITGDFTRAVRVSSEVLAIRGRIFPSTNQLVSLEAVLEGGKVVHGESRISRSKKRIRTVRLVPRNVKPLPEVLEAFSKADMILIGPGSLYTSIIPNLLVPGVVEAIEKSRAPRIYVANLMTQPGETQNFTLSDHVGAIHQHTGRNFLNWAVLNNAPIAPEIAGRYKSEGSFPVYGSAEELKELGLRGILGDVVEAHGKIRHDSKRLAALLLDHFVGSAPAGQKKTRRRS